MLAIVNSCSLIGLESYSVQVEVDVTPGLPSFDIVGLPDTSIRESKERVRSAIRNSGFEFPPKRVTINLAPADIKKEGPIFDLPIALGVLAATNQVKMSHLYNICVFGELSLSGDLRKIPGVLAMASGLENKNIYSLIVPESNSYEAALTRKFKVFGLDTLKEVAQFLNDEKEIKETEFIFPTEELNSGKHEFSDIVGQKNAKRALEIAAAGGHNVLLLGPPGSGKTMLARSVVSILPKMTLEEAIETTKIYSVSGLLERFNPLITNRPFRAPHHNISLSSLIGGGSNPKPGEISLANNGVLFLDELTEYPKKALESLRQPLEDRMVLISRVAAAVTYPARFILIGALNPCPCGYLGDSSKECRCSTYEVKKYLNKISGPLLDRFDLQVQVPRVKIEELNREKKNIKTVDNVKKRVEGARFIQNRRFNNKYISCNAEMNAKQLKELCHMTDAAKKFYQDIYDKYNFTMRSYGKLLKISRTIADIEGSEDIEIKHLAEAMQYRDYDRLIRNQELY